MQLHQLKPKHKFKKNKRVGRGGKHGTYSGRGNKGQKSRAGRKMQPLIRELIKRYPKLKGYRAKRQTEDIAIVNLGVLEKKFESGENVSPQILLEKRIIRRIGGKLPKVKILGKGELIKKLNIQGCEASKQVKDKIKKAGGIVK